VDHTIGFFERGGVVAEPQELGEEGDLYIRGEAMDSFPDRVRDSVGPGVLRWALTILISFLFFFILFKFVC